MDRQKYLNSICSKARQILPNECEVSLGFIPSNQSDLYKDEIQIINSANPPRFREFNAGRTLARKTGQNLGIELGSILRDSGGCPLWIKGVSGSISHKNYICGAVLSISPQIESMGIDIEIDESLSKNVWKVFTTKKEINSASCLAMEEGRIANILLSSKEAYFKCLYPVTKKNTPSTPDIKVDITIQRNIISTSALIKNFHAKGFVILGDRYIFSFSYLLT